MKVGEKVKYTNPDVYGAGGLQPKKITVGDIYTIKDIREPPPNRKYFGTGGDCEVELQEVPNSWYGHKRFEPAPKSSAPQSKTYSGINI